jgi:hypothetical protein
MFGMKKRWGTALDSVLDLSELTLREHGLLPQQGEPSIVVRGIAPSVRGRAPVSRFDIVSGHKGL